MLGNGKRGVTTRGMATRLENVMDCFAKPQPSHITSSSSGPALFNITYATNKLPVSNLIMSVPHCSSIAYSTVDPELFNRSVLLQRRWDDSPKDDKLRLEKCWGYQDCEDCYSCDGVCGWCPIVSALTFCQGSIVLPV